jgi:metallo-beta-lactamase class B
MRKSDGTALLAQGIVLAITAIHGSSAVGRALDPLTAPITCHFCAEWNEAARPFRIYGNSYYVGVRGLSSVLIVSKAGMILIDGDLPQSAPHIEANIRALGFRVKDIKVIVNSHEHFDHVGGIAALQRDSGARVISSPIGAEALRQGHATLGDPQYVAGEDTFPAVPTVGTIGDLEAIKLGDITLTAHFTPGHTPGGTSWTWRSCAAEGCLDMVYGDSLTPVSAPGYRFLGGNGHADVSAAYRASIARVGALPCDILISTHPELSDLWERVAARKTGRTPDPMIDREGCRDYAAAAMARLDKRVAQEQKETP